MEQKKLKIGDKIAFYEGAKIRDIFEVVRLSKLYAYTNDFKFNINIGKLSHDKHIVECVPQHHEYWNFYLATPDIIHHFNTTVLANRINRGITPEQLTKINNILNEQK